MDDFTGPNIDEKEYALQTLKRYSGSSHDQFQSNLILTNFPKYVVHFAKTRGVPVIEGSMFSVAHCPKEDISIIDFKIGSPAAALVVQLCSHLNVKAAVLLGMCAGLRRRYKVGDYLVPVASIRGEGTSDHFLPTEVPALANFLMQRAVTRVLDRYETSNYHIGITYSSNIRIWEHNKFFREHLMETKAQGYEMECATIFAASYAYKFTLGALLLISDLPLNRDGVKTEEKANSVFDLYMADHIEKGVEILKDARDLIAMRSKGAYHRNIDKDTGSYIGLGTPKPPKAEN